MPTSNRADDHKNLLFRLLVDGKQDHAMFLIDTLGIVLDWNSGCEQLFGYSAAEIIGKTMACLLAPDKRGASRLRRDLNFTSDKGRHQDQGWWLRKDRSRFWGHCVRSKLPNVQNSAAGFAIILQDLTAASGAMEDHRALASIIENSDDAIISKSLNGKIQYWNAAAEKLFGYRQDEIIGQPITKLFPIDRLAEEKTIVRHLRRHERVDHYETVRVRKDGRSIKVSISVTPIVDVEGRVVGAYKIAKDISDRGKAEESLQQNEQLMRAILDTAADAIITIDQRGIILSINSATESLFGYPAAELVNQNVSRLMPEPFQSEHDGYIQNYRRTNRAKIIGIGREVSGLRKNGTTFPMHLSVSEIKVKDQRIFTGIVHDLSERRKLERQILEAASDEQRRIGQDLHDGLCQDLVGIAFGIDAVARNVSSSRDGDVLEKLATSIREAAGQARQLAHGLNPVDLKAGGLPMALENLAVKTAESFGLHCTFRWDHKAEAGDDIIATHLYRIAQEAVANAVRHGHAKSIELGFVEADKSLVLSIGDDGEGLPDAVAQSVKQGLALSGRNNDPPGGMGLQTMHYRAHVIGAIFSAYARLGGGTMIQCRIDRDHKYGQGKPTSGKLPRRKRERDR